jgi:hypothetical protein
MHLYLPLRCSQLAAESPALARDRALRLREQHDFTLHDALLCLGRLESSDFSPLAAQRKETVQAFWTAYFAAGGEPAEIQRPRLIQCETDPDPLNAIAMLPLSEAIFISMWWASAHANTFDAKKPL